MQNFCLLVAYCVSFERHGRLHRGQRHQLEQVVRHHVAQRSSLFIVSAPLFDTDLLGGGNLHAVDVAAVPDRLEDAVAETKHQDVLDGLFAKVVIDAIDLFFVQDLLQFLVQLPGRLEIAAERLFDHDAPPVPVFLASQPGGSKALHHRSKVIRRSGQIEKVVALRVTLTVDPGRHFFQTGKGLVVIKIAGQVVESFFQPLPDFGLSVLGSKFTQFIAESFSKLGLIHYRARHADDRKIVGQQIAFLEIVESRDQLSFGEITGRAEDHHDARWANVCGFDGLRFGFLS